MIRHALAQGHNLRPHPRIHTVVDRQPAHNDGPEPPNGHDARVHQKASIEPANLNLNRVSQSSFSTKHETKTGKVMMLPARDSSRAVLSKTRRAFCSSQLLVDQLMATPPPKTKVKSTAAPPCRNMATRTNMPPRNPTRTESRQVKISLYKPRVTPRPPPAGR